VKEKFANLSGDYSELIKLIFINQLRIRVLRIRNIPRNRDKLPDTDKTRKETEHTVTSNKLKVTRK
jgi:hypothetical protein